MTIKSFLLIAGGLFLLAAIYRAWRGNRRFHDRMKKSDYTVDFTKKV